MATAGIFIPVIFGSITRNPPLECGPNRWLRNTCLTNPKNVVHQYRNVSQPAECCALCFVQHASDCKSWSHWQITTSGCPMCSIYSSIAPAHTGNESICTSGADGPVPKPNAPRPYPDRRPPGEPCMDCPNIVFALTDDQDVMLGGWTPMLKTQNLVSFRGANLTGYRIHTPICCPSRSETVSGRYFHNIKSSLALPPPKGVVYGAANQHVNGSLYVNQSFGVYLRSRKGYAVGMFGKSDFQTYEGFDRWFQGAYVGYGNNWEDDEAPGGVYHANASEYSTDLLLRKTTEWLRQLRVRKSSRPIFVYFAPHCPHVPATPSLKYSNACKDVVAPRQPNYNWTTSLFHQNIALQPPLTSVDAYNIDTLARARCQCLLSVDDAYAQLLNEMAATEQAQSTQSPTTPQRQTYWFISSDHGYNLGNHRLPSNKMQPYEHSIKPPFLAMGPG